ncbi:hypothetical protein ACHAWF_018934 [Thalassiosira exigua]
MCSWAIITGAGSGIWAALFQRLLQAEPNLHCLGVGRRSQNLEVTKQQVVSSRDENGASRAHTLSADIRTPEGIKDIVSALPKDACVKYLVHSAALLGPIGPLVKVDRPLWRQIIETNLDAPLFLTQASIPHLKQCEASTGKKARVLHVGTGAAHNSYIGMGPYSVVKCGLHMIYRFLSKELSDSILVGSVNPGSVDTPIQEQARGYDGPPEQFPKHQEYVALKQSGKIGQPANIAVYFHWLLSEIADDEYVAKEFVFRCSKRDHRWLEYSRSSDASVANYVKKVLPPPEAATVVIIFANIFVWLLP